ncbi:putative olfactory receptor 14L1 [Tachyglossus aculeatus]|uniref:putative olfactory receptor 14L1 n=1 Tax=Tachyglossus aculeatus TaxID=9261 RepID=UPI0018F3B469|nr:putative olfactory receptor 14L1 [Tachyglossus aculeatus]
MPQGNRAPTNGKEIRSLSEQERRRSVNYSSQYPIRSWGNNGRIQENQLTDSPMFPRSPCREGTDETALANRTAVREFLLLGFSEVRELQLVHAALFLLVYLAALTGNLLIVNVTALDRRLHTPMYCFLRNLSILDLCLISVTVPNSVINSLTNNRSISFVGCVLQMFFFMFLASAELAFLTAMSYDRYVAICFPLRYEIIMSRGACGKMSAASWLCGGLSGLMHTAATFSAPFCGSNAIRQFFCDVPQLLALSDPSGIVRELGVTGFILGLCFFCSFSIVVSYAHIFSAVLKIRSVRGGPRVFSTCLPHLSVVSVFLLTGAVAFLNPRSNSSPFLELLLSMFYSVVPPALNPVIYSLRNRDLKTTLGDILGGLLFNCCS